MNAKFMEINHHYNKYAGVQVAIMTIGVESNILILNKRPNAQKRKGRSVKLLNNNNSLSFILAYPLLVFILIKYYNKNNPPDILLTFVGEELVEEGAEGGVGGGAQGGGFGGAGGLHLERR